MNEIDTVAEEPVEEPVEVQEAVEVPLASLQEVFLSVHRTLEDYEPLELPEEPGHELTSLVFSV